jgi:STE24 endopeptidase
MNESKATLFQRARRRVDAASIASGAVALALIAFTPASAWLAGWAAAASEGLSGFARELVTLAVFVICLVILWEAALLPAALYRALVVDRRFGVSARSVEDVLAGAGQSALVAVPVAFAAGAIVKVSVWAGGALWWLAAGGLLAGALALALRGAPAAFAWLADARPVDRPELTARLAGLAARARVAVARTDAWASDAADATALVTGVGRAKRVFISSDLLRDWNDDEIAVVVAHELAHHAYHDLWRTLALDALILSAALGVSDLAMRALASSVGVGPGGPGAVAALPLIALVAGAVWVAATPLRHAQSRRHERRADLFALVLTGAAGAFGAVIRRLGDRHLAEERPSAFARWLYFRHPSVAERLAVAEAFARIRATQSDST